MTISNEVLDGLLSGCATADDLLGEEGLFKQLKKALLERMLGAEPSVHLGYEKGDSAGRGSGNSRNGYCGKTVLSDEGALDLSIPRDRNGTSEPQLAPKGRRASTGKPVLGPAKAGPVGRPDHQALWPRNDGAGGPGPPPLAQYSGHTQCGRSGDVGISGESRFHLTALSLPTTRSSSMHRISRAPPAKRPPASKPSRSGSTHPAPDAPARR